MIESYESLMLLMTALASLFSVVAVYLAITEKNLVRAVIFSAVQSTIYAFIYYMLMAPDIVLVYVPVAVGLYPAVILILLSKTEKVEKP
ncbi:conserved hypothetical protein [Staphylothermus marinus F1]|uniref:MrpA C-terminal/MbhD domain-containing protein n=1 Tax=Staphylothermus marinus (strain ATCC 43588 / DSM 3639 / JCM 9404 / F1) TaxID=399550 RepID=A3DKH7_STAMF|nr:DUF4040 domain-containing protein [Staphylothermus marinus]ABN69137.1 conserved hypothetical protein [Staphylothermus marinus F1]